MNIKTLAIFFMVTFLNPLALASTVAVEAGDYFRVQAYSLFSDEDIKLVVVSSSVEDEGGVKFAYADLEITPMKSKQEIVNSVQSRLLSDYMRPEMPSDLAEKVTAKERALYTDMTTKNIAEYIVGGSLGDDVVRGKTVSRSSSQVQVLSEDDGREFLSILGHKVYVDGK